MDNRYKALWNPVERWGGPRLASQWAIYLREARERWNASKGVETARDYAAALVQAGHDRTLLRGFGAMFDGKLDETGDQSLQFVVPFDRRCAWPRGPVGGCRALVREVAGDLAVVQ